MSGVFPTGISLCKICSMSIRDLRLQQMVLVVAGMKRSRAVLNLYHLCWSPMD